MTLTGAASSDIDTGSTLSYAWVQVDPATDLPLDPGPTKVNLVEPECVGPTFVAPHFAASTTLKFRLIVTDNFAVPAERAAFTTVQINANRAPAVGTPTATPASRPIGTVVTITVPASAADADGDPVAGFTYQWVQTDSAGNPCAPTCAVANVTTTPVAGTPRERDVHRAGVHRGRREAVLPPDGERRLRCNRAVDQPHRRADEQPPAVQFAIRPKQMAATNSTTNNTTVNVVYGGQEVTLDAVQNPAQNARPSIPTAPGPSPTCGAT